MMALDLEQGDEVIVPSFTYVATAGGAFLEGMEGKERPGVAVLKRAHFLKSFAQQSRLSVSTAKKIS